MGFIQRIFKDEKFEKAITIGWLDAPVIYEHNAKIRAGQIFARLSLFL